VSSLKNVKSEFKDKLVDNKDNIFQLRDVLEDI
jgi:hypothetical protein